MKSSRCFYLAKSSGETNAAKKLGVSVSLKYKSVFRGVLRRNYDHPSTISQTGSHHGSEFLKTQGKRGDAAVAKAEEL